MSTRIVLAALVVLAPLAAAGSKGPGPADVAKQFYQLANEGKCADAERFFTPESVQAINSGLQSKEGFLQFCQGRGGKAAIASLAVRKEERSGDRAEVMLERAYKDGSLAFERDTLVRIGGEWKLSVGDDQATAGRKQPGGVIKR